MNRTLRIAAGSIIWITAVVSGAWALRTGPTVNVSTAICVVMLLALFGGVAYAGGGRECLILIGGCASIWAAFLFSLMMIFGAGGEVVPLFRALVSAAVAFALARVVHFEARDRVLLAAGIVALAVALFGDVSFILCATLICVSAVIGGILIERGMQTAGIGS